MLNIMIIERIGNSIVFTSKSDKKQYIYPLNNIVLFASDGSDFVTVKTKGNDKILLQFPYYKCENIVATGATDLMQQISHLSNN